jgi:predicted alpha/beta-hydrolase family hydrolase
MTGPGGSPSAGAVRRPGAILLTPGAGAGRDHHTLVAVQQEVAPLPCLRMDFPYRLAGRRAPDRAPVAVAHLVQRAEEFVDELGLSPDRLVLGGRSYGGRMCSIAVAQGLPAAGLVLLSYPLHPPGRPEKLRVDHFPEIHVPVLFVSGEKDPFGSPAEFAEQTPRINGPVTQIWIPGAHDPRGGDQLIAAGVGSWLLSLGSQAP